MDITNYFKRQKVSAFTQMNINRSIYEEANIRSRHSIGYKARATGRFLQPQQHFKVLMKYAQRSTEMHFFIIKHFGKTSLEIGSINKNDPFSSMFLDKPINEIYSVVDQLGETICCYIVLV